MRVSSSYNGTVVSNLFAPEVGQTTEFSVVYDLPPEVISHDGNGVEQELLVQNQLSSSERFVYSEFVLSPGYKLLSGSLKLAFTG